MMWEVSAKYGKRKRTVMFEGGNTAASIRDDVLHLVRNWYQRHSGTLGNEVWAKGVITVQSLMHESVVIYDPNQEISLEANDNGDGELAPIISLRP